MKKETAAALHSVVDEFERHTKTLRQLGEPIDAWSTLLEHLLCLRLDDGTLKAWEDFATTAENPDYNCIIEFLQRRIRVLESMSVNQQSQPALSQQPPLFRKPSFYKTVSHTAAESLQRKLKSNERRDTAATSHRSTTNASTVQISNPSQSSNASILLSTVVLMIIDANGKAHPARALLDNGSQSNIISERLCQLLRLERNKINIPVFGVGEAISNIKHSVWTTIRSRKCNFEIGLDFLVMPRITIDLPVVSTFTDNWCASSNLFLADPTFNKTGTIDILLGAEHFFTFVNSGTRIEQAPNLIFIDSVFGWIVTGRNHSPLKSHPVACHLTLSDPLHKALERFWHIEEIESRLNYSVEEQQCESHYVSHHSRTPEGRYIVRLPRHSNFDQMLGESKSTALRRFLCLETRLCREPMLKDHYHSFMSEYLSFGHMRLVSASEHEPHQTHYLPHHAVLKEASTTTKVRVVFDGSAKTSTGHSLNDALQVGPIVQDELLTLILRFRKYPIALVADIAKMYRQVMLHPKDTPLQRILWRFNPNEPVSTFELQTVTYGLAPSSYLATRTLQQLATDEGDCYPLGGPALRKGFYVDDYIGGADTTEEAIQTRNELDELLSKGGFELRKWTSNSLTVLEGLDPSKIGTQPMFKFDHGESIKALGVSWEPVADQLHFDSTSTEEGGCPTKRSILSSVSKHFDPLGLTAPVIIRAKMLLQELWLQPCGWDEEISDSIRAKWETYCSGLKHISSYRVNRYAFLPNSTVQLHTFADASQQAYGACIYGRSTDSEGHVHVQLIASKTKVAPLKRITIPRLELSAAVLAARLHKRVTVAMDMPFSESHFWSDSTVTLEWLRSPPYTWTTFVANRVSEIQTTTQGSHWHHVAGKQNPADLVTRGMTVNNFLGSDLWHHGPTWLKLPEAEWPVISQQQNAPEDILERRKMVAAVQNRPSTNAFFGISSSYSRLIRLTAYCLRFIRACRHQLPIECTGKTKIITVDEMSTARLKLIKLAQADVFVEKMKDPLVVSLVRFVFASGNQPHMSKLQIFRHE
ncbi:uncharacterized protein LOC129773321 [Toxorhynchites rutilus septentrionalis]|uniref:uncharacterized protein LOC129773321 n=1 Tax=Toxorhynchites rutilus septentrionalis TaxID=329112 RepID=UPI00247847FB|nr:uncharacterized protein LOC129773321 [Toxorhynchites rutilus septentrionalis]